MYSKNFKTSLIGGFTPIILTDRYLVDPGYKYDQQFLPDQIHYAFQIDSRSNTRPISMNVSYPDEIQQMFDTITYYKGASIIRMLQHILTPEVFRKGLNRYLTSRAFQSGTRPALYAALDAQAHEDGTLADDITVEEIFETWTLQRGYPLLTISRDYESGSANVRQERFLSDGSTDDENTLWWVPLTYTTQEELDFEDTAPRDFLRKDRSAIVLGLPGDDQFVIFNIQQTGYYRVNYDDRNWQLIADYLASEDGLNISVFNRIQLLDDSYSLYSVGLLNITVPLEITRYMNKEIEFVPWEVAVNNIFTFLNNELHGLEAYDSFKTYWLGLLETIYEDIGFDQLPNESKDITLARTLLLPVLNDLGNEDSSQKSLEALQQWMATPNPDEENPISPNYRSTIYSTAVREGGTDEWNFVYQRYLNSLSNNNDDSDISALVQALGSSRNETLLNTILEQFVVDETNDGADYFETLFYAVLYNNEVPGLPFNFLSENFDEIHDSVGPFPTLYVVLYVIEYTNTREGLEQVEQLIADHSDILGNTLDYYLADAESRLEWLDNNYNIIAEWLNDAIAN